MTELTLRELRDTHPVTTASVVEALEDFIDECNYEAYAVGCDCVDCEVTNER